MAKNLKESTISRSYAEGIIESMINSMLVVSADGAIVRANRISAETFGYSTEDLLGMRLQNLLPEATGLNCSNSSIESYGVTKDKSRFPVVVSISLLDEKNLRSGNLRVYVIQDISESKKLENEIKQRNHALSLANQELEAFSYSVSHDLRAPLWVIDGFSQALLEDANDKHSEESKHHLSRIRFGVQRMGDLIDAVINLARISRASMVITKVDMSQLGEEVAEELRLQYPRRKLDFIVHEGMVADADASQSDSRKSYGQCLEVHG